MYSDIPTYHERLAYLIEQLREQGHLGLILIDASELAQGGHDYGPKAFHQVLSMVSGLVGELQGKEVRTADMLALNDRGGNAFLLFLSSIARASAPPASKAAPTLVRTDSTGGRATAVRVTRGCRVRAASRASRRRP